MPRVVGQTKADREARWQRVINLSKRGVPAARIAEVTGMSVTHVFRIRAQCMGRKTSRRPFTDEEIHIVESMLKDGVSVAEIARTIGRHPATVQKRWPGRGWDRITSAEFGVLRQCAQQALPGI